LPVREKIDLSAKFAASDFVSVEIGCGDNKRDARAIGIDIADHDAVDLVGDAVDCLKRLPDDSIHKIESWHCFEHLSNLEELVSECERVLKKDGEILVIVPHFSNPFFYSDPTHQQFFGLYTFSYFCRDNIFVRRVPTYKRRSNLLLEEAKLVFKSFPPRYLTHGIRKILGMFFNLNNFMKEIYEDSFSSIITCYEIEFRIKKTKQ